MNVVIVIDSLAGGGAEKVMLTLAEQLVKFSHNVTILSLANSFEYDIPEYINVDNLFLDIDMTEDLTFFDALILHPLSYE